MLGGRNTAGYRACDERTGRVGSDPHLLEESPRLGWTAATASSPFAGSTPRPSRRQELVVRRSHPRRPRRPPGRRPTRSFGILSTLPPDRLRDRHVLRRARRRAASANGGTVDVVRCGVTPTIEDPLVARLAGRRWPRWVRRRPSTCSTAPTWPSSSTSTASTAAPTATTCSTCSTRSSVPSIVVAHTVVRHPTAAPARRARAGRATPPTPSS